MLMKTLFFLLTMAVSFGLSAQTQIRKSSISSGGGSSHVGNITVIYALGEVAIAESTQGNTHVSEGFIGPDIAALMGVEDYTKLSGVQVYPNPAIDELHVAFGRTGNYRVSLFDASGKLIYTQTVSGEDSLILPVSSLATGIYFVGIVDTDNNQFTSMQIQKK